MITINFTNEPNFDEIAKAGITMICDENMNLKISKEDYRRLKDEFEAAYMDSFIVKDDDQYYHYKTQDRETGTLIDLFYTKEYAEMAVAEYEKQDKENGTYTPDFYEVKELDAEEYTRYRIGQRIQDLRKETGMTQTQLAEKCGMAQPNIARIEAGTYATSLDVLSRIAEALGKRIELV
jgi:DNA-binding XRE family transcriptional regulator